MSTGGGLTIGELTIADPPGSWRAAGFAVTGHTCAVGGVRLRLVGRGPRRGIVSWSVRGARLLALDGLETREETGPPDQGEPHPNGVVAIDHVVLMTPALDRTAGVLREAGFDLRRLREGPTPGGSRRQAFFRMGEPILEVVEAPAELNLAPDAPARLWGISFLVADMDGTAQALDGLLGSPRDAVQPGRTIATLSREAGIGTAVAFITPAVR